MTSLDEANMSFKTGFFTCHFEDDEKLASKEIKQDISVTLMVESSYPTIV